MAKPKLSVPICTHCVVISNTKTGNCWKCGKPIAKVTKERANQIIVERARRDNAKRNT